MEPTERPAKESDGVNMPRVRNEVNINTVIQITGFLGVIVGIGVAWGQLTARMEEHHRVVLANTARIEQVERKVGKQEQLDYRLVLAEEAQRRSSRLADELRELVNSQGTDLRVIREILGRLEKKIGEEP